MANNRSVARAHVSAMDDLLSAMNQFEATVKDEIVRALAEGKRPASLTEKEKHKITYFSALWGKTDFSQVVITDAQSVVNHFTRIHHSFNQALQAYCDEHDIKQQDIFVEKKVELFKAVVALRQTLALQRYSLSAFTPTESAEKAEGYFLELSTRSMHVQNRMVDLKEKMLLLAQENTRVLDLISVLVQHVQERGLGFESVAPLKFNKPYEDNDLTVLSTFLNGLPSSAEVQASTNTQAHSESFERAITFFETDSGWMFQTTSHHDAVLGDWLRRQEELARLVPNVNIAFGEHLFSKVEALQFDSIMESTQAVIKLTGEMGHSFSPNKVWSGAGHRMGEALKDLQATSNAFCAPYEVHRDSFQASQNRVRPFMQWYEDEFKVAVSAYQADVNQWHHHLEDFLLILHHYQALTKQSNFTACQQLGFFLKHNGAIMGLGGLIGAGVTFPICWYLFSLDLTPAVLYATASLFLGTGSGAAVGAIKEHCRPTVDETKPLVVPAEPEKPKSGDTIRPSFPVSSWVFNLFPGVQYPQQDVELGGRPKRPSYGSIN